MCTYLHIIFHYEVEHCLWGGASEEEELAAALGYARRATSRLVKKQLSLIFKVEPKTKRRVIEAMTSQGESGLLRTAEILVAAVKRNMLTVKDEKNQSQGGKGAPSSGKKGSSGSGADHDRQGKPATKGNGGATKGSGKGKGKADDSKPRPPSDDRDGKSKGKGKGGKTQPQEEQQKYEYELLGKWSTGAGQQKCDVAITVAPNNGAHTVTLCHSGAQAATWASEQMDNSYARALISPFPLLC
eukprot:6470081-Amphidinium_carterae.1